MITVRYLIVVFISLACIIIFSCASNSSFVRTPVPTDWTMANSNSVAFTESFRTITKTKLDNLYKRLIADGKISASTDSANDPTSQFGKIRDWYTSCIGNAGEVDYCYSIAKELDGLMTIMKIFNLVTVYQSSIVPAINAVLNPQQAGSLADPATGFDSSLRTSGAKLYFVLSAVLLNTARSYKSDPRDLRPIVVCMVTSSAFTSYTLHYAKHPETLTKAVGLINSMESKYRLVLRGDNSELNSISTLSEELKGLAPSDK